MGTSETSALRALATQRVIDSKLTAILESLPEVPVDPQPEYFI